MRRITALIHTENDERRVGRCLEMLYPCDSILIVDHGSHDRTLDIAREYGATIVPPQSTVSKRPIAASAEEWLLCLSARESVTEGLAASLYECKLGFLPCEAGAFAVALREETGDGWIQTCTLEPRLVHGSWSDWNGPLPMQRPAPVLCGELLRFRVP
jgi:glycosyltransferase involved in cell wall biosynthesis